MKQFNFRSIFWHVLELKLSLPVCPVKHSMFSVGELWDKPHRGGVAQRHQPPGYGTDHSL